MLKINIILSAVAMLLIITAAVNSCDKEDVSVFPPDETHSDVIPLSDALSDMENTISYLYGETKASRFSGYSIQTVTSKDLTANTRASSLNLPDTLLYLINFPDSSGFSVLSASRSLSIGTYCVTESGSVNQDDIRKAISEMSDHSEYPSDLDAFVYGIDFIPSLIASSIILDVAGVCEQETLDGEEISTKADNITYGPFLKTKWGQTTIGGKRVFNRYTPNNASCGCVVTAVAQIMVANKYPMQNNIIFDGKPCNWQDMETVYTYENYNLPLDTTAFDQVAHFVRELGKHDNVKIRYGDSDGAESRGYAEGAQRTFQNYGYRDVDKHLGFGKNKRKIADKNLRAGRPVYLDGNGKHSGHAWVLDGLKGDFYHINWGWYGKSDGYYKKGVFRTSQRSDVDSTYDSGLISSNYHHYYKNFRMVTYGAFKD